MFLIDIDNTSKDFYESIEEEECGSESKNVKKTRWTAHQDCKLREYIEEYGVGFWRKIAAKLFKTGK